MDWGKAIAEMLLANSFQKYMEFRERNPLLKMTVLFG